MPASRPATVRALPQWQALVRHAETMREVHLRTLMADDPQRFARLSIEAAGLLLDYSKNRISDETLGLLRELADAAQLRGSVRALFAGERVNPTEDRAALHTALRNRGTGPVHVDGEDVMPAVRRVLGQMRECVEQLHEGRLQGATGRAFTDVVAIGIGGSYLGPLLASRALAHHRRGGIGLHFVANLDPRDIDPVLARLDPETTLFLVASKSFTTVETATNAATARGWLARFLPEGADPGVHFLAVTANTGAAQALGIARARVFEFWDWVGGRYSLWSAIGLPIALLLGMDGFEEMLDGAWQMDRHFLEAPLEANLPVTLALLGVWYTNFLGAHSHAVVPYDQRLELLPAYLQQLDMESNGKRVTRDGRAVDYHTAPVLWGGLGTNCQHAFFQLLHQGTRLVPVDFIAVLDPELDLPPHHELLIANCFAQSRALMLGRDAPATRAALEAEGLAPDRIEQLLPHKVFPGNAPSNTIVLQSLSAAAFGALIAAYEHKTFAQSAIWGINCFDQWGVELGKQMAREIGADFAAGAAHDYDPSTRALIERYRRARAAR